MADLAADPPPPPRRSKLPLVIGAVLAVLLGAGGFFASYSGLVSLPAGRSADGPSMLADSDFVPLAPILVSLGGSGAGQHVRFAATLEVAGRHRGEVEKLMPRILDVLNGYLRAVDPQEFAAPGALIRLRAQMLRRVQVVTGEGRVRDLLVTEFVLN